MDALAATGEGSSFTFMIETVGMGEEAAGSIRPSFLVIAPFFEGLRRDVF